MATPTNYIFTSGSCAKNAIFDLIINSLKSAGWTDVASLASSDFVVLTSSGNAGDKNLIINLRDTNVSAANSVKTTAYCQMSYRLQTSYSPGAAGVAGTWGRTSQPWVDLYIAPVAASGTLAMDTVVNYKVYADASKIILAIEFPSQTGYNPLLIYLGEPDTLLASDSNNRGCLFASSANAVTATSLYVCDSSDGVGSVTAPYALTCYAQLPPGDPNGSGKRMVSSIYYGSATEGYRGKLDGIKCMLNSKANTGDTVTIGSETYYVLIAHSQGNTSFPSAALLVRTA